MLVIYSALSYKTPWCLLGFYHGMILLAAVGVVATLNLIRKKSARVVVAAFFVTAGFDLATQTFTANFISYTDPSNPYVYAHPTKDVFAIAERIKEVSRLQPAGRNMPVWVVCRNSDYWPLPWYLRSFENIGWCSDVNEIRPPAPVVIASAALEDELKARLYDLTPAGEKNLYVPLFDNPVELRPGIELRGYVTKDLRDKLQKSDAGN
jgi:predicted membrane-bound mannosyltransferase